MLFSMAQSRAHRVTENRDLGGGSFVLRVAGPFPETRAGQFCMLRTELGWPVMLPRPFSWFDVVRPGEASPRAGEEQGAASFLGKAIGPGTRHLASLAVGDEVLVTGPLGRTWPQVGDGPEPVCIAGGVGLAPFLLWAKERHADVRGRRVQILYGGASASAIVAREDFAPAVAGDSADGPEWHVATDDGSLGFRGNVLELYRDLAERGVIDDRAPVYCCGPDPMMEAVAADCRARAVRCVVSLETYMACGFGVCNGCSVEVTGTGRFEGKKYVKSCVDGPVFDADELLWAAAAGTE